jgi:hypothetical protein
MLEARPDIDAALMAHDEMVAAMDLVSPGPAAKVVKNVELIGRGVRQLPDATTDVWALGRYAYIGTFNSPCGDGTGANGSGIRILDVHNKKNVREVGFIPSPLGSRSNDVKVAVMNSGTLLVHSNESCAGGPGGVEIWNVDDPEAAQHLAHIQTNDINVLLRENLGFTDFGVHNLFLFTQGTRDYLAVVVESVIGNFQIFDLTDPANPVLVGFWGAEQLAFPTVDWASTTDFGQILAADDYLRNGFGQSQNRFLHDVTINAEGTRAYLSNWDAGLVLLDISDPTSPQVISVALDPTSSDGEVNSHAAWPSVDGSVVVESNEDFSTRETLFSITSGPNAGSYPAAEGAFTTPILSLPGAMLSGPTVYVGFACPGDAVPPAPGAGFIALVQRGPAPCRFDEKASEVIAAGYAGMVVFNDAARGDALVSMGGNPRDIPGVFVGHATGLAIAGVASDASLVVGAPGASVAATASYNPWGALRIWDYADPANPVLASNFFTVCSANPADPSCDLRGTYSVHNVVVESTSELEGDVVVTKTKAYISWYSDGVLVLDVTDPYNPVEVGRYHEVGAEFEMENGGIQNVWGIYKVPDQPWIYASDRNGGLYVFKELGSGSGKKKLSLQGSSVAAPSAALEQNTPNPFNPMTTIAFSLTAAGRADLRVHDAAGRLVRQLVSGALPEGRHQVVWDGTNDEGVRVGSGIYFYTLRAGDFVAKRKLVLLK